MVLVLISQVQPVGKVAKLKSGIREELFEKTPENLVELALL